MNNKTTIRIYKDNFRESILRSLVFTNNVIFVLVGLGIAAVLYVVFGQITRPFDIGKYLGTVIFFEILFVGIATLKRDNQPIYKLVYRVLLYFTGRRKQRSNFVDAYFTDFKIQDDLIVRKKSISKVFLINPDDISALNESDSVSFFAKVKQALHALPSQLQIIVKKEVMKPDDVNDHLASIYKTLTSKDTKREEIIQQYNRDLKERIATGRYLMIRQYGVFAQEVDTNNVKQKVEAIGRLSDMYKRFDYLISTCGITTKRLTNNELINFARKVLQ